MCGRFLKLYDALGADSMQLYTETIEQVYKTIPTFQMTE